ncbi:hypothetical protein COY27_00375 [Candidatus Woesearchaeota archaeon CG_4_10_14_0_2_um_filter_33_13]|nr:MAG: hypothetical protein COY27_00375 [Candidatus Woesearchaeota archaeon CG_4_10_14_0_2_um_filter_33_13]
MTLIYQTDSFIVESHDKPFVSREEGGHLRISIKDKSIIDRTMLSPKVAIELIRLTMIIGKALEKAMTIRDVPIIKVNYQDMGNWAFKKQEKPFLHVHILGRSKDAKIQVFPESVQLPDRSTGFYENFKPLNKEDILEIKRQIAQIIKEKKYDPLFWELNRI